MRKFLFWAAVSAVALTGSKAMAADISETGHINARIVEPIDITETQQLNFGAILQGQNLVKITPGSVRSADDGTKLVGAGGHGTDAYSSAKAGEFEISGPVGARPTITFGATDVELTGDAGGTMTVNNFNTNADALASEITGTAGSTGSARFNVGADLHVNADQTPGNYTGTYTVDVHY